MNESERLFNFMAEYEVICRKYGYRIHACGCCFSPWPVGWDEEEVLEEHLRHLWKESKFPNNSPFRKNDE